MSDMTEFQAQLDERLEQTLKTSNYRAALETQLKLAKLHLKQNLTFSINGGTFLISQGLISFVGTLIANSHNDAIILDVNDTPIEIERLDDFQKTMITKYYEAHNDYMLECKRIRRARNAKAAVGV